LILNVEEVILTMLFHPQLAPDLPLLLDFVSILIFLPHAHLFYFFHPLKLVNIFDPFLILVKSLQFVHEDQYLHFQLKVIMPVQVFQKIYHELFDPL